MPDARRITMARRILPVLALVAAMAAPLYLSGYDLSLLGRFLAMAILAMGLVVIWGHGGILSLGQGVFFGIGGYALAMHMKLAELPPGELPDFMMWSDVEHLPLWWSPFSVAPLALVAAVLLPALAGLLIAWALFRRRVGGTYFALITQALALVFATLLVSQQHTTGGFNGLTNFPTLLGFDITSGEAATAIYWITLALLVIAFAAARFLLGSRFGTLLRASRDGENRVRFLGYNPTPYKVAAFAFSAMLAGVAGALYTLHSGVISPAMVGVVPSIEMVICVAIGGRHSLAGAIAGALLLNFARDAISSSLPELWLYFLGLLFILVVTLMPRGLAGAVTDLMARLPARQAAR